MNPEKPTFFDSLLNLPRKFFGWLFNWRTIRRCLIGLAVLITLVALGLTEEHWRGKRAWEKFRAEQEAKGEHLDLAAFLPPPVPDEQNFLMTPLLAPLFDCRFDPVLLTNVWRDPQAAKRGFSVGLEEGSSTVPSLGKRRFGERINLAAWQAFYRTNHLYPQSAQPQSPAADVLVALGRFDAEVAELVKASQRPHAQFKVAYEDGMNPPLMHYSRIKQFVRTLTLRAVAELQCERSEEALADILVSYRFADALQKEPTLMALLVRVSLLETTAQAVWEGLVDHRWSEPQLRILQEKLQTFDLLKDYEQTMRGERAFGNAMLENLKGQPPPNTLTSGLKPPKILSTLWSQTVLGGFFYQNQLTVNQLYAEMIAAMVDVERHRLNLSLADHYSQMVEQRFAGFHPYAMFAKMLIPALLPTTRRAIEAQVPIAPAVVACALERYRLSKGQYPATLDVLAPAYLDKVPLDVINGQPLRYRREADGTFVLYSVGMNGKDDGGKTHMDAAIMRRYGLVSAPQAATNPPKYLTTNLPEGVTIMRRYGGLRPGNLEKEDDDWVWRFPAK